MNSIIMNELNDYYPEIELNIIQEKPLRIKGKYNDNTWFIKISEITESINTQDLLLKELQENNISTTSINKLIYTDNYCYEFSNWIKCSNRNITVQDISNTLPALWNSKIIIDNEPFLGLFDNINYIKSNFPGYASKELFRKSMIAYENYMSNGNSIGLCHGNLTSQSFLLTDNDTPIMTNFYHAFNGPIVWDFVTLLSLTNTSRFPITAQELHDTISFFTYDEISSAMNLFTVLKETQNIMNILNINEVSQ